MTVPNRSASSAVYRYGFNGMEMDDEIKGLTNSYDYGKRFYDPRVGRFLSLDPLSKAFPYESNYNFVSNNPIIYNDPTGEAKIYTITIHNKQTGKTDTFSIVIDEDYIESKVSKRNEYFTPTEYSWHDLNIVQNITIEEDGSVTMGDAVADLLDHAKTTTPIDSETLARGKMFLQWIESPGKGEIWSGGGIDFYSKKGEGSGTKAKDKDNVDYVNGDEILASVKSAKGFGTKINVKALNSIYKVIKSGKLGDAKDFYDAAMNLKKILGNIGKAKKITEEIHKITKEDIKPKPVSDTLWLIYDDGYRSKKFYTLEKNKMEKSLNNGGNGVRGGNDSGNEPTSPDHYKGG